MDVGGHLRILRGALAQNAASERPRVVVDGDFGSGKSHLMRAAVAGLSSDQSEVAWVELSGLEARTAWTGPLGLHARLLDVPIDRWGAQCGLRNNEQIDKALRGTALEGVEDVRRALRDLLSGPQIGGRSPRQAEAKAWLTGSKTMSPAVARRAGYANMAAEVLPPMRHAVLLDVLASLAWDAAKERLGSDAPRPLFVLDEGNSFANLRNPGVLSALGEWTRALVDPDRRVVGLLCGLVTPRRLGLGDHPFFRVDVRSRIPLHVSLPPLGDLEHTRQFLDVLWAQISSLVDRRPFRLDEGALHWIHSHLHQIRTIYAGDGRELLAAEPSRRDLLRALQMVGESAAELSLDLVRVTHLQSWFTIR